MRTDDDLLAPPDPHAAPSRQRQRRRALSEHLVAYLAVNTTLCTSWLVVALAGGTWFPWPLVAMVGWGIGLVVLARSTWLPLGRAVGGTAAAHEPDRPAQRR